MADNDDKLTLIGMQVRNIMGIRFADVDFGGIGVFKIGGNNGQGKTSLRESAIMCLGGARYFPEQPVHGGSENGEVVLRFDKFILKREIKADRTTTYKLTTPDGKPFPGGSLAMLQAFREAIAFDPMRFNAMQPTEQASLLQKMVGIDLSDLEARRAQLIEERNEAGRDRKGRETQLLAMPTFPDAPTEEINPEPVQAQIVDAKALMDKLQEANDRNAGNAELRRQAETARAVVVGIDEKRKKAHAQIKAWQEQLAVLDKQFAEAEDKMGAAAQRAESLEDVDLAAIQAEVAQVEEANRKALADAIAANKLANAKAQETNRKVRLNKAHAQAQANYEEAVAVYRRLDKAVEEIDRQKAEMVASVKFPVPGIGFGPSGVTFNGHPYAQASDAEKLRVSTAIGLALHPEFPNPWITDGSLLDRKSLKMIEDMAKAAGGRVIVEVVTDDPAAADILIEDGAVKGASVPAAEPEEVEAQ